MRSAPALLLLGVLGWSGVIQAERLPIRTFTVADGLAGDTVRNLLQDSRGFLWIGTSSGLSRFDGQSFRNYDTRDGLCGPRVEALAETRDGSIWAGTGQGLSRLAPDARAEPGKPIFERIAVPDLGMAGVGLLFADRQGALWITGQANTWRLGPIVGGQGLPIPTVIDLPADWHGVALVTEAPNGDIWLANQGLARRRGETLSEVFSLAPNGSVANLVAGLRFDDDGRLWMTTGDGAVLVTWPGFDGPEGALPLQARARPPRFLGDLPQLRGDIVRYDTAHGLPHRFGLSLSSGPRSMWITSHAGAVEIGPGRFRALSPAQGLPEELVMAVLEDRDGTVWIGSESRGLSRLRRSSMVTFDDRDGLPSDRVSSLAETPDGGLLLVGTESRDLARRDGERFVPLTPQRLFDRNIFPGWGWNQYAMRDRRGRFWFPTGNGLYRFAAPTRLDALRDSLPDRRFTPATGLPGKDVFRLYEDRNGDLWVSIIAPRWPLVRLVDGERIEIEREIEGANHGGAPTAFAEDRAGGLWMGFYLGSLARRDATGWRFFGAEDGLPPGFVSDLHVDRAGRLWMATNAGGIAVIDDPTAERLSVRRYGAEQGLSSDSARCLAEGSDGAIYVGNSRGVDRLDLETGSIRSLSVEDGMPNNFAWTCLAARDGRLWFGTLHGLVRFDPRAETPRRAPALRITALRVAGQPVPVSALGAVSLATLELAPSQNSLEVDVETLGLDQDARALIQHRLGGGNTKWSSPAATRTLSFPRLSPGSYALEVRAVSREGRPGSPASFSFRLMAPLAERLWFRVLAAALAILALFAAYRMRLARLLAVERARTRIASDLHDDVGSGLSRIGMLSEIARRRLDLAPQETAQVLEQMSRETAELAENASEIVWSVDPHRDDFESLVVRLRRFAADLLEARDIALGFSAPREAAQIELRPEVRRAVYLILKESIHNAGKHSGATRVDVTIVMEAGEIRASVTDDGRGIDPELARQAEEEGHRGLPGLRRRAAAVGGEVNVETAPGRGTRISLRVPLRSRRRISHRHAKRAAPRGDTTASS